MSKLLLDEKPLMILPQLAVKIGLNEAIILQQIHYWLLHYEKKQSQKHFRDGHWWVYNTYENWQENFPFWSVATIKRTLTALRKPAPGRDRLLVATSEYNQKRYDKTLWYRIDYEALQVIEEEKPQVKMTHGSKCPDGTGQNDPMEEVKMTQPIPETTTDHTETNGSGILTEDQETATALLQDAGVNGAAKLAEGYSLEHIKSLLDYAENQDPKLEAGWIAQRLREDDWQPPKVEQPKTEEDRAEERLQRYNQGTCCIGVRATCKCPRCSEEREAERVA